MKSVLLFLLMLCVVNGVDSTTVYLCDSPNAKKYHFKATCRGLNNCAYRIRKTTLTAAKQSGKTICLWED